MNQLMVVASLLFFISNAQAVDSVLETQRVRPPATYSSETSFRVKKKTPSRTSIRPVLGYAFLSPQVMNEYLDQFKNAGNIKDEFQLGGATNFGVGVDYSLDREFSVGAELHYFGSASSAANYKVGSSTATVQGFLSGMPLYLTGTYRRRVDRRWVVGAVFGIGFPLFYRAGIDVSSSQVSGLSDGGPSYSARPLTWMGTGFAEYRIRRDFSIRASMAYRALSSDQMTLDSDYEGIQEGRLLEGDEKNIDVNASSFLGSLDLVYSL